MIIPAGIIPAFPFGAVDTQTNVSQIKDRCEILSGRPGCVDVDVNVGLLRGGELKAVEIMKASIPEYVGVKFAGLGTTNLTSLVIMGLAKGVSLFGNGFAHDIIEEVDTYYKDLVVNL
jgi:hypothetical protein